jgi:hypothetical protein
MSGIDPHLLRTPRHCADEDEDVRLSYAGSAGSVCSNNPLVSSNNDTLMTKSVSNKSSASDNPLLIAPGVSNQKTDPKFNSYVGKNMTLSHDNKSLQAPGAGSVGLAKAKSSTHTPAPLVQTKASTHSNSVPQQLNTKTTLSVKSVGNDSASVNAESNSPASVRARHIKEFKERVQIQNHLDTEAFPLKHKV